MPAARPSPCYRCLQTAARLCVAVWLVGGASLAWGQPMQAGPQGAAERGRRLLTQFRCGSCHAIPGVADAQGTQATPLDQFGRRSFIAGRLPNTIETLSAWIRNPQALVPSTTMPCLGVSSTQARDMAAYLHSPR